MTILDHPSGVDIREEVTYLYDMWQPFRRAYSIGDALFVVSIYLLIFAPENTPLRKFRFHSAVTIKNVYFVQLDVLIRILTECKDLSKPSLWLVNT